MKAVRYLVIAMVAVIVLIAVAIAIAVAVIDPNHYKPQIEKAVEDATNLDLVLDGDIGWSFIPLGLELNSVEATLDGERFVKLDQLVAQVGLLSLIRMSPQVDTFVLDGLDARLVVDADGNANWDRIVPQGEKAQESEAAPATEAPATAPETVATEEGEAPSPLNFNVEHVQISNAQIHYDDQSSGQSIVLEGVTLNASDITLGQTFPFELAFRVATAKPQFSVDGSLRANVMANEALNQFALQDINGRFDMGGEPFGGKNVLAQVSGSAAADLENESANLENLELSLADLKLSSNLNVKGFGDAPQLSGNLRIDAFSLKKLLAALGQQPIETSDPDVLQAIAFATAINGPAGKVSLDNITLQLDDTNFSGNGSYTLDNGAVALTLQGTALNVDRYLPPAEEGDTTAADAAEPAAPADPAGANTAESDLLPLDALRTLALNIQLGLEELVASNLTITELNTAISANNGLLKLDDLSGKMYQGEFDATATLDARTNNPKWALTSDVAGIQVQPLLMNLAEVDMLTGGANLDLNITTMGNRMSALRNNAGGEIKVSLAEGQFTRMNLTRMACQGIALANQESLAAEGWGTTTEFNDLHAVLKIDGNTLTNTDLVAALAGMKLEGDGTVDLSASELDYEAGLRIVGEIHRDPACRVTEYVENVVIPLECRGSFDEDPAGLCSFDGSRFRDTLKDIAANAARAKAEEEIDRARERAEEKVTEELERHLDSESADQVRDALRGLFGQ
ncbi:AsmA family protein [Marinobacter zhejiangensis]|uniref:AsmA protein n=1 Tax=Marinobacter zhejiangensis TaxID=488535 RepID=A0A1I4TMA3_9GAMM|nr:AsmA family protein [Marinobacter zhejiangensis]SFM77785.1 AsmA protein [Marinobacter zhejiangensis]